MTDNKFLRDTAKQIQKAYAKLKVVVCTQCHHEWTEIPKKGQTVPSRYCDWCNSPAVFHKAGQ